MSAATAAARRSTTVAGRPGRAGRGPEPLAAASIIAAINTGFAGAAARPAEVPKFRYRPLSEVRLRESLTDPGVPRRIHVAAAAFRDGQIEKRQRQGIRALLRRRNRSR